DYDVDVLVVGAGNGGLTAFLAAADGKAKTLLIEVSGATGGSTLTAGGILHTSGLRTWADYNKQTLGLHDQVLGKVFVETFWDELIPWLQSKGAYMSRPTPTATGSSGDWVFGKGENLATSVPHRLYFDSLSKAAQALGGTMLLKTRAVKLYADDQRRVVGLQAMTWSGSPLEPNQKLINIKAKKVILATGNFYANKEMLCRYIGHDADTARNYGMSPYQTGEGIAMAQAVGAMMSGSLSTFSGSTVALFPAQLIRDDPVAYEKWLTEKTPETYKVTKDAEKPAGPFTQSGANANAILVNLDGKRFWDESNTVISGSRRMIFDVVQQRRGRAWVIADQNTFDADTTSAAKVKAITDLGGKVFTANTLEEFATLLQAEQGMYKPGLLKTIAEYNAAIDNGTTEQLDPPRTKQTKFTKISKGPFYAFAITSNIYYNAGGLAMNADGQTLDYLGRPIPNLYAIPPCGGGIMTAVYTGGIAAAGTFGYRAGKHAAANLNN
ncbi:MAG: FAD-binding protein, partial [Chloroflexota bacterium]|nr:FAD-binding protein [Chloroflexota bacterium]